MSGLIQDLFPFSNVRNYESYRNRSRPYTSDEFTESDTDDDDTFSTCSDFSDLTDSSYEYFKSGNKSEGDSCSTNSDCKKKKCRPKNNGKRYCHKNCKDNKDLKCYSGSSSGADEGDSCSKDSDCKEKKCRPKNNGKRYCHKNCKDNKDLECYSGSSSGADEGESCSEDSDCKDKICRNERQ